MVVAVRSKEKNNETCTFFKLFRFFNVKLGLYINFVIYQMNFPHLT